MEKYVYVKRDISGYYVDFGEMLNPDLYDNLGTTYEDFTNNKWVLLSDEQVAFHLENPTASVEEVLNMQFAPRTIEMAKAEMLNNIDSYDSSSNVNSFTVNGVIDGWFTADERSNYKSSIDAAKLLGVPTLQFFIGDTLLTVTPQQAEIMLAQIQLYADQCYIVTKGHKIAVESMTTVEEVDSFDHTQGYPQRINFTYPFE